MILFWSILGKVESFSFDKKRPALIVQSDKLNFAVQEGLYNYSIVAPLSTKEDILTEEFRIKISKREGLEQESFVVCNSICFLHKRYIGAKSHLLQTKSLRWCRRL